MKNSNLQAGKFYKEQSAAVSTFRYTKAERVIKEGSTIYVIGEQVTAFNDYYAEGMYIDQGRWQEISQQEFEQAVQNSHKPQQ